MSEAGASNGGRTFGGLDHAALWGSVAVTLYAMPFGSLLVPALSLRDAFLAVLLASFLGGLLLAAVAALAARSGSSSADLLGRLFGGRSTPLLSALLIVRHVAWGAFALSLIAGSAALVSDRALGAGLRPLWVVGFGLIGLALVLAGPDFTVRKLLRRAAFWLALLVAAAVTVSAYLEFGLPTYLQRPAVGGWPSFWQAVDVMLIVPLLWLPLVADYARHGRDAGTAFWGTFGGFFPVAAWLGFLGVVYLPAVETGDISGFVVSMQLGLGALIVLLVLQADEPFLNVHSARVALAAALPADPRIVAVALSALVVALALPFDLLTMEGTLLLLASLFVPLYGVLMAQRLLGGRLTEGNPAPAALTGWAAGFLLYHWIAPAEADWWRDALGWALADVLRLPFPLTEEVTWLGAAIPSFMAGALVYLAARLAPAGRRIWTIPLPAR